MHKSLRTSLGTLIIAAVALVAATVRFASSADLPDMNVLAKEQKRKALIEGARHLLIGIKRNPIFDTLLIRANCEVAESRLEQEYGNADAAPMMIASSLVPLKDQKNRCFFFVWCFNPHREDDALLLVGHSPDGKTVRIRYEFNPTFKRSDLVGTFGGTPELVSMDELLKKGKVSQSDGETAVGIMAEHGQPTNVPDLTDLAVAIHDKNGKLSNFVPVRREKPVKVN